MNDVKVVLGGLSKYSDTLQLEVSRRLTAPLLTGVLLVNGVEYFYVQGGSVGVRYNRTADPKMVAAEVLSVFARSYGVEPVQISVKVGDMFVGDVEQIKLADEIAEMAQRLPRAHQPAPRRDEVVARGSAPAYYLAD